MISTKNCFPYLLIPGRALMLDEDEHSTHASSPKWPEISVWFAPPTLITNWKMHPCSYPADRGPGLTPWINDQESLNFDGAFLF